MKGMVKLNNDQLVIKGDLARKLLKQGYDEDYIFTTYPIIHMGIHSNSIATSAGTASGSSSSGGYSGGGGGGGGRRWWRRRSLLNNKLKFLESKRYFI